MNLITFVPQLIDVENSIIDYLEQKGRECEDILECITGFGDLEKEIYLLMLEEEESLTVDEVAETTGKERSTAFRALKKLVEQGFVEKDTQGLEGGSYVNVYSAVDSEIVSKKMRTRVDEWETLVKDMIDEFEEEYS